MPNNERRRIAVFEDSAFAVGALRMFFDTVAETQYSFVVISSIADVNLAAKARELSEAGILLAIVDGNMDVIGGSQNEDGMAIVSALREQGIYTIGYASTGSVGADVESGKRALTVLQQVESFYAGR